MPINDPIRDRKVAPNSLAFPIAGAAGGAVSSSTYQSTVQNVVNNPVVYADSEVQNRDRHALSTADREAEHRSKAWVGDWHRVTNASDGVSISIHVYGGNVGAVHRRKLDETSGRLVDFVSGYDNAATPNLWGRPAPTPC